MTTIDVHSHDFSGLVLDEARAGTSDRLARCACCRSTGAIRSHRPSALAHRLDLDTDGR